MSTATLSASSSVESVTVLRYAALAGRVLFATIFIIASLGHFSSQTIQYAASQGVPLPSISVPLTGLMSLIGGLSFALGYKARYGAILLIAFLVPVTFMMHSFWTISDPAVAELQKMMFLKNMSLTGAALMFVYFGSGPMSIDALFSSRKHPRAALNARDEERTWGEPAASPRLGRPAGFTSEADNI